VALDAARVVTKFEAVTLFIGPGRAEPGREMTCEPGPGREVATRVEGAVMDATRLLLSGRVFFDDEGAGVTLG